ncbi:MULTISPECIES: DUF3560 domain-containing protein [unclassified Pseudovibrio]|uniref:DUF3560 domain-containing protein n=1 Tax=unclassified Pseudovibrio TaxID=2627060 RepID=UPI0007B224E0|nr:MULTISPECIES: DUF3560 domain-containing protein [unclassified Pseudovibrio]KZK92523.1 hypothetical protein PsW74_05450 [Pseudovibrio sp. W74]KZL03178.1 hypothetical protein PsAD14_05708 [Pseudovibrio sp. Ad14]
MTKTYSQHMAEIEQIEGVEATYSPEDNKLRLYAEDRFDEETYAIVKSFGFNWAPKQKLFVAPAWTPEREDFCVAIAGDIEAEGTTLAERAAAKAERLEDYAANKERKAGELFSAADELSRMFEDGQPILAGHHSERKALKTKDRMDSNLKRGVESQKAARHYLYKAVSVQHHANFKNSPKVRANRIKALFVELRKYQSDLNHYALALKVWEKTTSEKGISGLVEIGRIRTGSIAAWETRGRIKEGEITLQELRSERIAAFKWQLENTNRHRWVDHLLNRLAYENEMLGGVSRFEGEITATLLQTFARAHGADKPKATKTQSGNFELKSIAPLPFQFMQGETSQTLELTDAEWRELMKDVCYVVPVKKDAKPSILNFKAENLQSPSRYHSGEISTFEQIELTKAEYAKIHAEVRGTRLSVCGKFRFKICLDPNYKGPRNQASWVAVFLTDSKAHPVPESCVRVVEAKAA